MSNEIDNTPTSPMKLAKLLGIPPQKIYGLIRQGRVKEVAGENKKKLVHPKDVLAILSKKRGPGRPSTKEQLDDFRINPGTVLVWVVEIHKQVAVVEEQKDYTTRMAGKLDKRKPKQIYMRNTALSQYIKEGKITVDDCDGVLEAVVLSWRLNGREEQAARLQILLEELEQMENGEKSRRPDEDRNE